MMKQVFAVGASVAVLAQGADTEDFLAPRKLQGLLPSAISTLAPTTVAPGVPGVTGVPGVVTDALTSLPGVVPSVVPTLPAGFTTPAPGGFTGGFTTTPSPFGGFTTADPNANDPFEAILKNSQADAATSAVSNLVVGLLALAFACYYKSKVVDEMHIADTTQYLMAKHSGEQDWDDIGLFGCFSHSTQCLYVWCCPLVTAAKNFEVAGVTSFWQAFCCLQITYSCGFLPGVCYRTYLSTQLKKKFGISESFCGDFFLNWCCLPCEVGRESIFIDEAMGCEVECPPSVTHYEAGPAVNPAMGVRPYE